MPLPATRATTTRAYNSVKLSELSLIPVKYSRLHRHRDWR